MARNNNRENEKPAEGAISARKEDTGSGNLSPGEKNNPFARRQSAPRPTEADYLQRDANEQATREMERIMQSPSAAFGERPEEGETNGFSAIGGPIGKEHVRQAYQTLLKYKTGKANLERRIVENEEWYKLNQWGMMPDKRREVRPVSAWLFNCIANKHADAMDNFPEPNILPREEEDKAEAEVLTAIIPVVLDQNDFEQTYSDIWTYKLKAGTGVYGVFWDPEKLNGIGDISVVKVDLLNLFWEPGITDIQRSAHLFHVQLTDNEQLLEEYPQLKDKLSTPTVDVAKYRYDDTVDTSEKSLVVDWYYHRRVGTRKILHMCKFVNEEILFASENDPQYAERGWYDHGMYPFVFDPMYEVEGSPAGFGYIDIGKGTQTYISRCDQVILENALFNARPRYFINAAGSVNEAEFSDSTQDLVHVDGNLGQDSVQPIEGRVLPNIYYEVLAGKINELKETTGNRDVNTGGTTSGATAASAIAAMQEAGGKLARDNSKGSYRAYRRMILMVIELIRQFYEMPRQFRIIGVNGAMRFVNYTNAHLQMQRAAMSFGIPEMEQMTRLPIFDVAVSPQKSNPYSKASQNEMALQLYTAGFFNPMNSQSALMCLDMMDINRKEELMQKIAQQGMMFQQVMALQQAAMAAAPPEEGNPAQAPKDFGKDPGQNGNPQESTITRKARARAAESSSL